MDKELVETVATELAKYHIGCNLPIECNSEYHQCAAKVIIPIIHKAVAEEALDTAARYGQIDGDYHKAWVIDQMVRMLTGDNYGEFIREYQRGEDGDYTYEWDTGIPP